MDGWKQKEGLKSHWKGFKRWHWWPGGRPRGRTAPAGRRWRRRGWVLRTWGQPWSCRPPGRLPAPPPDGPDARRGRDTWGGERKEGEESRGSKIGRQEEKGYGREILLQKHCKNNKKQKEKDEAKKSVEEKNRTTQAIRINPTWVTMYSWIKHHRAPTLIIAISPLLFLPLIPSEMRWIDVICLSWARVMLARHTPFGSQIKQKLKCVSCWELRMSQRENPVEKFISLDSPPPPRPSLRSAGGQRSATKPKTICAEWIQYVPQICLFEEYWPWYVLSWTYS